MGPFGLLFRYGEQTVQVFLEFYLIFLFGALQFCILGISCLFFFEVFQKRVKCFLFFIEFLVLAQLFRLKCDLSGERFARLHPLFAVFQVKRGFALRERLRRSIECRQHTGQFADLFQKSFIGPFLLLQFTKGLVQFFFFALRVFERLLTFPDLFLQK